jgi:hypothetical protein
MRFDPAAFWHSIADRLPAREALPNIGLPSLTIPSLRLPSLALPSLTAIVASSSAALATAIVGYVVWTGGESPPSDEVVVNSPVFKTVALTPPMPVPAARPRARDAADAPHDDATANAQGADGLTDPDRFADQVSVVRAVQQQLKRAGCYSGRVNGVWSPSTRKAMAAFTTVVNARLPVNRADPVLLVLIESNPAALCSPDCARDGGEACGAPAAAQGARPQLATLDSQPATPEDGREDLPARRTVTDDTPEAAPPALAEEDPAQPESRAEAPLPRARETENREIAAVDPEPSASDPGLETAALPAAAAASAVSRKAARPDRPRVARRYKKQPSFSRQVSKGFKSLQRSLNKLF